MSFVTLYIVSSTGPDDGHRLAAFSIVSSFGMTNCSRTLSQNFSSGEAGVGGSFGVAPRAQARSGVTNGTAPPMARIRANSRRFMKMPPKRWPVSSGLSRKPAELAPGAPSRPADLLTQLRRTSRHKMQQKAATTAPEWQPAANQPGRVAVDQLHMDPVDEQRAAAQPSQRRLPRHDRRKRCRACFVAEQRQGEDRRHGDHQDPDADREPRRRAGPERRRRGKSTAGRPCRTRTR